MKCELCGKECNGLKGISLHITKLHHNTHEYYNTYLKKDGEGVCMNCGKPTSFIGFGKGYNNLCLACEQENSKSSQCQICGQFCKNLQSLHTHIRLHKVSDKDYYDTYLKQNGDGFCPMCNKPTRFYGLRGYRRYCSMSCATSSPEAQEKIRETSQRKYNTNSPNQVSKIKEKQKRSLIENFGDDFGSERYKRASKTMQDKFGVDNMFEIKEIQRKGVDTSHSPEANKKRKTTYREVYGTDHHWQNEDIQRKVKQTLEEKYGEGVENSFQAEEVKDKIKSTMTEKYGVPYAQQSEELKEKAKKTRRENTKLDSEINDADE